MDKTVQIERIGFRQALEDKFIQAVDGFNMLFHPLRAQGIAAEILIFATGIQAAINAEEATTPIESLTFKAISIGYLTLAIWAPSAGVQPRQQG